MGRSSIGRQGHRQAGLEFRRGELEVRQLLLERRIVVELRHIHTTSIHVVFGLMQNVIKYLIRVVRQLLNILINAAAAAQERRIFLRRPRRRAQKLVQFGRLHKVKSIV